MRAIVIINLILSSILVSCNAPRAKHCCGLTIGTAPSAIPSEVVVFERTIQLDTTIALIQGHIQGVSTNNQDSVLEPAVFVELKAIDKNYSKGKRTFTDVDGHYNLYLEPGKYDVRTNYIGFNPIVIRSMDVEPGDVFQFDALLGQSGNIEDSTVYEFRNNYSLIRVY
jgi:hypothetical protein